LRDEHCLKGRLLHRGNRQERLFPACPRNRI
jgi:hypothetical protein